MSRVRQATLEQDPSPAIGIVMAVLYPLGALLKALTQGLPQPSDRQRVIHLRKESHPQSLTSSRSPFHNHPFPSSTTHTLRCHPQALFRSLALCVCVCVFFCLSHSLSVSVSPCLPVSLSCPLPLLESPPPTYTHVHASACLSADLYIVLHITQQLSKRSVC